MQDNKQSVECKEYKHSKFSIDFDTNIIDKSNPILEKFRCSICFDLAWDPIQISCKNCVFCRFCINEYTKNNVQAKCPLDRKPFNKQDIVSLRENVLVWTLINSLKIRCPLYNSYGCDWIGQYGDVEKHINNCKFVPVDCSLCQKTILRNLLDEHMKTECEYRYVDCKDCGDKEIPFLELKYHSDNNCVTCAIPCKFSKYGCGSLVLKGNVKKHEEDYKEIHLNLVTKILEQDFNKTSSFIPITESLLGNATTTFINGFYHITSLSNFPTVTVSNVGLKSGKWYYEAIIKKDDIMQIGWRTSSFNIKRLDLGIGDCNDSCGFDGNRQGNWHGGFKPAPSTKWSEGDVIGLGISLLGKNKQEFKVWKNGNVISTLLTDMIIQPGHYVYPALSLGYEAKCCLVFHNSLLKYLPKDYSPIYTPSQFSDQPITPLTAKAGDHVDVLYGRDWVRGVVTQHTSTTLGISAITRNGQITVWQERSSSTLSPAGSHDE